MSAGEVDVRVLGTKFNLKSYAEDSEVEVTLVAGQRRNGDQTRRDDRIVRLRPGELVKLDKRTGSTETFDVPTDTYRPVVCGGGLFFMDKRFDEIVAYLEKRFDVKTTSPTARWPSGASSPRSSTASRSTRCSLRSMPTRRCAFAAKAASSTSPNANPQKKPPME